MRTGVHLLLLGVLLYGGASAKAQGPGFDHLAIYVSDLPQSLAFYRDVVGLDTLADPFRDGKHAWLSLGPGSQLHLIAGATRTGDHPIYNHLALRIPSVDAFVARLQKRGGSLRERPGAAEHCYAEARRRQTGLLPGPRRLLDRAQ